jgi:Resolvase, N terminal domain
LQSRFRTGRDPYREPLLAPLARILLPFSVGVEGEQLGGRRYRGSTEKQGRSGLGLEAQQEAVRTHLNGGNWRLASEVVEIESGKRNDRPKLAEALRLCRLHGATLIIAKLDRLARNAPLGRRSGGSQRRTRVGPWSSSRRSEVLGEQKQRLTASGLLSL